MAPPRPPLGCVNRDALLNRLAASSERRVTVVTAPAGFGKTTLLAEWCKALRAKQNVVAWLSLDDEDNNAQQFGAYLVASFCHGPDDIGSQAQALLRDDPLTPVREVLSVLLNEIAVCGRQVFLVLDDFDQVESRVIRSMVLRLLRYASDNLHVLLGVRSEPRLALGELRTQGQLLTVDATDLRFSTAEAETFFAQVGGVAIDNASVRLLNEATDGWVTGLQLASLGLRSGGSASKVALSLAESQSGIDAYLEDTVLRRLAPSMLRFLLRTSILDRLSAGVCDAIMGKHAHSGEILDWLEQHNIFIRTLDDERRWFGFHALILGVLRRRLARQSPDELQSLHERASKWFAKEQLWPEAVRHALAAGEWERAAAWVEDCAMAQVARGDMRTVLGWLAKLPEQLISERVRLRLAKAWALALSLRTGEASKAVEELRLVVARGRYGEAASGSVADMTMVAEMNAISAVIATLADNSPRALELGRQAADCRPSAPWVRRFAETTQIFGLIYASQFDEAHRMLSRGMPDVTGARPLLYADIYRANHRGLSALVQGRLPEAIQIFESVLVTAEAAVGRNSAAAVLPAGCLAALYYERNDIARTQQVVNDRVAIMMETSPAGSLVRYCSAAASLYGRQGDTRLALVMLEEARELASLRGWFRVRAGCDAVAIRLHLRKGRIEAAQQVADALRGALPGPLPSPMGSFLEAWASYNVGCARLDIASGHAERAVQALEELRIRLATAGMRYLEACASVLLALAYESMDNRHEAMASLERSLLFAQNVGMVSSFIDEGEPLLNLLQAWRQRIPVVGAIRREFVDQLFSAFTTSAIPSKTISKSARGPSKLLSAREIEVLSHISHGLSNKEAALAIGLAPETVEWHLKNIFEKLNVGSRIEAIQYGLGVDTQRPGT